MLHPLTEWKRLFLQGRSLERPNGAPLYSYRMKLEEFEHLEKLLRERVKAYMKLASLTDIAENVTNFPALFVLYAAEWWHRRYDGSGWSWEPIMADLGLTAADWGPMQRGMCVEKGLQDWSLHLTQSRGLRYLGSIAFHGGLPMELLASARGSLGRVLGRVLLLATTGDVSAKDVQDWIRSLANELPHAYRQSEIYLLLAEVILTVLRLRESAKLTSSDGAIAALDRYDPEWRNQFPMPIEDVHAQSLIDRLMRDAAKEKVVQPTQRILVDRSIEPVSEGVWQLRSDITFPEYIDSKNLISLFGIDDTALTRFLTLRFSRGRCETEIALRKLAGHDRYRLTRRPLDTRHEAAAAEHLMALVIANGEAIQGVVTRGIPLNMDLPWVMEPAGDATQSYRLVLQGSGSLSGTSALLCIPANWIVHPEMGSSIAAAGSLAKPSRSIWKISGTVRIEDPDGPFFRVRCGQAAAEQEYMHWNGTRMWHQFERSEMAFCGIPTLYRLSDDKLDKPVHGSIAWRMIGGSRKASAAGMFGPVDAVWPADGETKWRSRIVLLPDKAKFIVEPGDSPESGTLRFANWNLLSAKVDADNVSATAERVGNDFLLKLTYEGPDSPPEWCSLRLVWAGNPNTVHLRVPFPAKGARAFDGQGRLLASGSLIAGGALQGVRFVGFCGNTHQAELCLELHTGSANSATESTRRTIQSLAGESRVELRLIDCATEINRMLADGDALDTTVHVRLKVGNGLDTMLRVARYSSEIIRVATLPGVALPQSILAGMRPEQVRESQMLAVRLDAPGDEPVTLAPQLTEGVPTGAWHFPVPSMASGPWLIYPRSGSGVLIRPMLFPVVDQEVDAAPSCELASLASAMRISEMNLRSDALDESLISLADNFLHADWQMVDQLANQLGHLPLAALDIWRRFARMPKAMAAIALRMGSLPTGFVDRFPIELPMMWETIIFDDWRTAMAALHSQAIAWCGETDGEELFNSHLARRIEDLTTSNPSLRVILEVAKAEATCMRSPEVAMHIEHGNAADEIHRNRLFEGQDCLLQRLLRINGESKWPGGFGTVLVEARREKVAVYMSHVSHGFHDAVIDMPILLGYLAASSTAADWTKELKNIRTLRAFQKFDSDWFIEAFDLTVARCLARQEIPISYSVSRTLSDGTKVFQRNAASAG